MHTFSFNLKYKYAGFRKFNQFLVVYYGMPLGSFVEYYLYCELGKGKKKTLKQHFFKNLKIGFKNMKVNHYPQYLTLCRRK